MWDNSNKKALDVVENECPYCHQKLIMNKRSFANHVRWCKSNPEYEKIKKSTSEKCKNKTLKNLNSVFGEYKEFRVVCANEDCKKEFEVLEREFQFPKKEKYYCCRSCANSHKKTEESKTKTSESVKQYMRSIGRLPSEDVLNIKKFCKNCGCEFHSKKINAIFCSKKCSREYRNKKYYKENFYKINCEKEKIKFFLIVYRKQCSFRFSLNEYPEEFNFDIIRENGWYKAKNHGDNMGGVSRDHMFSVNDGFLKKIDPYLISHPANCTLLLQSENAAKCNKSSITIEELKNRIYKWEEKYGKYENKINYEVLKEYNEWC